MFIVIEEKTGKLFGTDNQTIVTVYLKRKLNLLIKIKDADNILNNMMVGEKNTFAGKHGALISVLRIPRYQEMNDYSLELKTLINYDTMRSKQHSIPISDTDYEY